MGKGARPFWVRGRVGCVKRSADAPIAEAEALPVGRRCVDPPYKMHRIEVRIPGVFFGSQVLPRH